MNRMKQLFFYILSLNLCLYQALQPMQQAGHAARATAEDIASAVSNFFSEPQNIPQQESLTAQANIKEIMNDPEFQQSVAQAVEEELEETKNLSSDNESSSQEPSFSTEEGIPLSEIIQKVRDSKLAQWLGFSHKEPTKESQDIAFSDQDRELLRVALHGRLIQEDRPELAMILSNGTTWLTITTEHPELMQNLSDGFYGKTSKAALEDNINDLKELLLDLQPTQPTQAIFKQPQKQPAKQTRFWDASYKAPQPTPKVPQPMPKISHEQEPRKRIISQAPPKPTRSQRKNVQEEVAHQNIVQPETAPKIAIEIEELETQQKINQDIQTLLKDEAALEQLIKKAACAHKQKATHQAQQTELDESRQRSTIDQELECANDQLSKAEQQARQHAHKMQKKREQDEFEQKEFDRKQHEQYNKKQRYLKKRDQEEKNKLAQEQAELKEREHKKQQEAKREHDLRKKLEKETLSRQERKDLKHQNKKQHKAEKAFAREQKEVKNREESLRTEIENSAQDLYGSLKTDLQKATQANMIQQQEQQLKEEQAQRKQAADELADFYEQFAQEMQTSQQEALAQQHRKEQQLSQEKETAARLQAEKEQEEMLQNLAKNMQAGKQDIITKQQAREKNIADLFTELPETNLEPTDQEQTQYDAAIAQRIGQKRIEIELQREAAQREKIEQELQELSEKIAQEMEANKQGTLKKQQERETADLFKNLPDSDAITSAKTFSPSAQPEEFKPADQTPAAKVPQPTPTNAQAKAPSSYAKEPFSDENAQAVNDMFKNAEKQDDNEQQAKAAPEPNPIPQEEPHHQAGPPPTPQEEIPNAKQAPVNDEPFAHEAEEPDKANEPGQAKGQEEEKAKEQEKEQAQEPFVDVSPIKPIRKKVSPKPSVTQKEKSSSDKKSPSIITPQIPQPESKVTTNMLPTITPSTTSQKKPHLAQYPDWDMSYDMPITENKTTEQPSIDQNHATHPTASSINPALSSAHPYALSPQESISQRSKELHPDLEQTQRTEQSLLQENIVPSEIDTTPAHKQTLEKQPKPITHQTDSNQPLGIWDRFLTFFNSILLIIKNWFASIIKR